MYKNNDKERREFKKRLNEKDINRYNDNNNEDPYGYDFVPTIAHWTNIDEQRKEAIHLENITKERKSANNGE